MTEEQLKKLQKVYKEQVSYYLNTNESWTGSITLADDYMISYSVRPEVKKRSAQSLIDDELFNRVVGLCESRKTTIKA